MRRRLTAAGALVGALFAMLSAVPAHAAPVGGFTEPANGDCSVGQRLTEVPKLAGRFDPDFPTTLRVKQVVVTVTPESSRPGASAFSKPFDTSGNDGSISFAWTPPLVVNGPHGGEAKAIGEDVGLNTMSEATDFRRFCLAIPPKEPTNLTRVVGAQAVTISWKAGPEGDLAGYQVQRAEKGSTAFKVIGVTPATSFSDDKVPANGDWQYQVRAVRYGVSEEEGDLLLSDWAPAPVASVSFVTSTTVPGAPPADGSGAEGAAPGSDGAATGSTDAGGSPATQPTGAGTSVTNPTSLRSLLPTTRAPAPRAQPRDSGFKELLPFAARPPGELDPSEQPSDEELGAGEETGTEEAQTEAVGQRRPVVDEDERRRSLSFLAGGLLTFVMLMQVLWIKGEVKRAPDLETEPVPAGPGPPAPARRGRRPARAHGRPRGRKARAAGLAGAVGTGNGLAAGGAGGPADTAKEGPYRARRAASRVPPRPGGD